MPEVLIPPDILPQDEIIELVDDGSVFFAPAQGKAVTQVQQFYEPRLRITQRFKDLRGSDRARLIAALRRVQGKFGTVRAKIGKVQRGSFPSTELLANNTFANGTTGHSGDYCTLAVADRVLRATASGDVNTQFDTWATTATLSQGSPYIARSFYSAYKTDAALNGIIFYESGAAAYASNYAAAAIRLSSAMIVPGVTGTGLVYTNLASYSDVKSSDYFDLSYTSVSRCFLVDNRSNLLTYSDQFDNAAWTKAAVTVNANDSGTMAPDGTQTADNIVETTANSVHYTLQAATVTSEACDICFSVALKTLGRSHCWIQLTEATGGTGFAQFFNITTGAAATLSSVGANWSSVRAFSTSLGNGWFKFTVIARKTNASTSVYAYIGSATADAVSSYVGNTGFGMYNWRATLTQSSVPTRLVQTTSAAVTSSAHPAGALYVKGLPVSTSNLLAMDDVAELNGEALQLTASLDSDAAGLGYLQFSPTLFRTPSDNDPIIVNAPMPKLRIVNNPLYDNKFGVQSDIELVMEQFYE